MKGIRFYIQTKMMQFLDDTLAETCICHLREGRLIPVNKYPTHFI
jgi:hypothetical protein